MSPWTRRRTQPDRTADRLWFDELPEDVLVLICCQCRIEELFALRLTNSKTRNLITEYIATIAPAVARSTFPLNDLLLQPSTQPFSYSITWLKNLIPQQLASILVDRHRFSHNGNQQRYGIPAEDPYGDVLRARVANGWRVLRKLSKISKYVYNMAPPSLPKKSTSLASRLTGSSRYKFDLFQRREELVFEKRIKYIGDLPLDMVKDYKLMFMLLSSVFRTSVSNYGDDFKPWIFDWGCGIDGQRLLRRGNSWLTWFLLHEGPDLFWDQWWSLPPELPSTQNYIRDRSIDAWFRETNIQPDDFIRQFLPEEWNDVNEKWHSNQRDNAFRIHKAVDKRISSSFVGFAAFRSFYAVNPIHYFTDYADYRQLPAVSCQPPVRETLSQVPFHVDFRCPEELFQRFCSSRKDRVIPMRNLPRGES